MMVEQHENGKRKPLRQTRTRKRLVDITSTHLFQLEVALEKNAQETGQRCRSKRSTEPRSIRFSLHQYAQGKHDTRVTRRSLSYQPRIPTQPTNTHSLLTSKLCPGDNVHCHLLPKGFHSIGHHPEPDKVSDDQNVCVS